VALNSASFNAARMLGPAVAGVLIAAIGEGWLFVVNAGSYAAVLFSLWLLRVHELHTEALPERTRGSLLAGFRYVWNRPDLMAVLVMLFLLGTFGFNFAIFISTMSVTEFQGDASQYGLLTSAMAVGTMSGALLSARRPVPGMVLMAVSAGGFGLSVAVAAVMPGPLLFGVVLVFGGLAALAFLTASNSLVRLATERAMGGRALGVGALSGIAATAVAIGYLARYRGLRLTRDAGRLRLVIEAAPADETDVRVAAGERVT